MCWICSRIEIQDMCEAENFKQVPKSWLKTDAGHTPKDTESVLDLRFYRHEDCTFTVYASGFRSRTAGDTCHAQHAPLQKNVSSEDSSRTPLSACPVPGFRDGHRGIGHVFQDPGESLLPLYPQTGLAVITVIAILTNTTAATATATATPTPTPTDTLLIITETEPATAKLPLLLLLTVPTIGQTNWPTRVHDAMQFSKALRARKGTWAP